MKAKFIMAGAAALALSGCLPSLEKNAIVVDGEASVEFAPDLFKISGAIRARNQLPGAALAEASATLTRVRETLPQLEALANLRIDASGAQMQPVQDRDCLENARYRDAESCPIIGYFGSIQVSVVGAPAEASGAVFSLLSELGVEEVALSGYMLLDMEEARETVIAMAVEDARAKAEKIASAAGAALGAPTKIQFGSGFPERYDGPYPLAVASPPETVTVTGSRTAEPTVSLDLSPQPIKVDAKVVAAFALD